MCCPDILVQVDFRPFAADVEARQAHVETDRGSQLGSSFSEVSGRGYEFHRAIEKNLGKARQLPHELRSLPQAERVRRLARELQSAFEKYDTGKLYRTNQLLLLT